MEQILEIVSSLETQIESNNDQSESVEMFKQIVKIINFIDNQCSYDYMLKSIIKKINDIKSVLSCKLYEKFNEYDFETNIFIDKDILDNIFLIFGKSYGKMLENVFCLKGIKYVTKNFNNIRDLKQVRKSFQLFLEMIHYEIINSFSNDWNIICCLFDQFKIYIIKKINCISNITVSYLIELADLIKNFESCVYNIFQKRNIKFDIDKTILSHFDENTYCLNLYLNNVKTDVEKFKKSLRNNFNVKYNTGNDEYTQDYEIKIQPFNTALDLFTFIKKIIGYTTKLSKEKILKMTIEELTILLTYYGSLLLEELNITKKIGFNKISECCMFNIIATSNYCMISIDSMENTLKLSENGTATIEKIKTFYLNSIFLKTINVLAKELNMQQKYYTKQLQNFKYEIKNDKYDQERLYNATTLVTDYINNVLTIYGDNSNGFIKNAFDIFDEFSFSFVFKLITCYMIDGVYDDMIGLKNVNVKYNTCFYIIFEKLLERIHLLFADHNFAMTIQFQPDIDIKLTKIKKIIDAISIENNYTINEHNKIFNDDTTYEIILQIKGLSQNILNITNIQTPNISNIPIPNLKSVIDNPVTNVVKDNAGKIGTFMTGAFDTLSRKDKLSKK